jgi:hypothetical protein
MASNFHESYAAGDVKPPSERATGLVFAAVALIVAFSWRRTEAVMWWALAIAIALAAVSLIAPRLLKPLNLLWFKFGLLLHRIVNPLVMLALFTVIFIPAGAIMRLFYDPLRLRRNPDASSYWIEPKGNGDAQASMTNQF